MIKGFADKETEKLWNRERSKAVPANLQRGALRKLTQLNYAEDLNDLRIPPGNKLEKVSGERVGQHSIRINIQPSSGATTNSQTHTTASSTRRAEGRARRFLDEGWKLTA